MSEEVVDTPIEESIDTVKQPMSVLNDDGSFTQEYLDSLPDELGSHSIFQKYTNPVDLVKGSINAQSMTGKKMEDFWTSEDPADVERRRDIMGLARSEEDYKFSFNEPPENFNQDEDRINAFKKLAFENNIPPSVAQNLLDWEMDMYKQDLANEEESYNVQIREAEDELRAMWRGDEYEYNLSKVSSVMDHLGLAEFKDDPNIGNNPTLIKAIYENIVPLIDNDKLIESNMSENYASLKDQLSEVESKMYGYKGSTHDSEYQALVKQRTSLLEKIT